MICNTILNIDVKATFKKKEINYSSMKITLRRPTSKRKNIVYLRIRNLERGEEFFTRIKRANQIKDQYYLRAIHVTPQNY